MVVVYKYHVVMVQLWISYCGYGAGTNIINDFSAGAVQFQCSHRGRGAVTIPISVPALVTDVYICMSNNSA